MFVHERETVGYSRHVAWVDEGGRDSREEILPSISLVFRAASFKAIYDVVRCSGLCDSERWEWCRLEETNVGRRLGVST